MSLFRDPLRENLGWLITSTNTVIFSPIEDMPDSFIVHPREVLHLSKKKNFKKHVDIDLSSVVCYQYEKLTGKKISEIQGELVSRYYDTTIRTNDMSVEFLMRENFNAKYHAINILSTHIDIGVSKVTNNTSNRKLLREYGKRIKHIAETLNIEEPHNSSFTKIVVELMSMLEHDKLPIVNLDLILSLSEWILDYIFHGKAHAISNIAKLKATHISTGLPLYSIVESL